MIAVKTRAVSIALACRTFEISQTCYRYERLLSDENAEIADWLERLTANRKTWGFGLCFLYLRNVKGFEWNHKRVYRIYCELELNLCNNNLGQSRSPLRCGLCKTTVGTRDSAITTYWSI